jgi:hypothetical protein
MKFEYQYESFWDVPVWLQILWFVAVILIIVAQWKVFEKAGQPGWASLIPFYNIYIMTKITGKPGYWVLLLFVPIVNLVILIWLINMMSKSFGHDEGFTLGLIFLGLIFWPILGFGNSTYQGPYGNAEKYSAYKKEHEFDFERGDQPPQ